MHVRSEDRGVLASHLSALVLASVLVVACGSPQSRGPSPDPVRPAANASRVLVITTTAGFRHDSIDAAVATLRNLAATTGAFAITATEDPATLSAETLAPYRVVMFALTTGELPLSASQKQALIEFVERGGGFIGVHSAADTFYDWPDYGRLVGAYFRDHPWTQQGTVIVEDPSHPATNGLGGRFSIREEFYTFRDNPRPRVQVLLRLDAASVGASGDYPLAWSQAVGGGRSYYNALGHFAETWSDPRFQQQIVGAIRWAAGR